MISIKGGTKVFSDSKTTSFGGGADEKQALTDAERQKYYGGKDIGEILNKVSDPNWVDPAKQRKVGGSEMDKDAFLKLFLAQMKNQDPTNPLQNHELASHLAQFTTLEKLNNINTGIDQMVQQSNPDKSFETLSLIGKGVAGDSSKILRSDETSEHAVQFSLPGKALTATVEIKDAKQNTIRTIELNSLEPGTNSFTWKGDRDDGSTATPGEYRADIIAKDPSGRKLAVATGFKGIVTGVNFSAGGPVLMIGNQTIKLSDVKSIFEPKATALAEINQAAAVAKAPAEGDVKGATNSEAPQDGNLGSLGMDRGMINKLKKQTGNNMGIN